MKSAILASLIATAAAFAPAQQKATSTAVRAFEDELGSQPPLGFFDPLGLLNGDVAKSDSTVSDMLKSSTDAFECLPSLDKSPPVEES
eukprot:CAMPEP_0201141588 /NCGR_PEP_ID=MMETSP0851-20130426/3231_1 /ASSEMBLY_ACC=CAM_ASM_000631 /TAXON_ID=183588 /ORGANISM="Pseudo-nitzschia fraudulenta, Strain WWA7" /LENGTH=87 /DNA_ID=CAMNT_0047414811 /DNA_START=71 /DNA_END=332 /DNA_ORIENTATION=+